MNRVGLNGYVVHEPYAARSRRIDLWFQIIVAGCSVCLVLYVGFVLVPQVRELTEAVREMHERNDSERTNEAERQRQVKDLRERELIVSARLLAIQEQALRQAEALNKELHKRSD